MNIDNLTLSLLDVVSAVLCFVLVWFMTKPYRYTGEQQYLGLPLAFSFLGASFVIGLTLFFEPPAFVDVMRWLQLFTQSYAFAFLAVAYYFSKRRKRATRSYVKIALAAIFFVALFSYIVIFLAPVDDLSRFNTLDDYMRIFNIVCISYIAIHTLRSESSKIAAKIIWIPLSYLFLDFSQYSFLIWSLDASFLAFAGAHFLRLAALLVFIIVVYQTFYLSNQANSRKELE